MDGLAPSGDERHRTAAAPRHAHSHAHAHVKLVRGARSSRATLARLAHIDDRVRRAGLPAWRGEVNAVRGRRRAALERVVGETVDVVPNRTYTWLEGRPVERLTIERTVAG